MKLKNIASAVFLLDQKVDIEEFISRVKDIAINFNNLTEEQKMMMRHWLRVTLNDEVNIKLGQRIEDILISKKEEAEIMTSNISKTIKETFEQTREEGREEGRETEREKSRIKDVERVSKLLTKKFKDIDNVLKEKIEKLDSDKLNLIIENILDIESLQEVEKYL